MRQVEFPENLTHDPRVGAPGEIDVRNRALQSKHIAECRLQSAQPGSARGDECTVDVPQQKVFHRKAAKLARRSVVREKNDPLTVSFSRGSENTEEWITDARIQTRRKGEPTSD